MKTGTAFSMQYAYKRHGCQTMLIHHCSNWRVIKYQKEKHVAHMGAY